MTCHHPGPWSAALCLSVFLTTVAAPPPVHLWEMQEITLHASAAYPHPYTDVECWVDLKGPGFSHRVSAFWDGGDIWRVRLVDHCPRRLDLAKRLQPALRQAASTASPAPSLLKPGPDAEKQQNPNRRGFLHPTANAHALQYADGTPYFLLGDTWLAAATSRLPMTGVQPAPDYEPAPGISFEQAVAYRKRQGYNSVSFIAAFPTWTSDQYPATYADSQGIFYRNAWEKFGVLTPNGEPTAKDMTDERGYRSFEIVPNHEGLADFDAIVPQYFQSLDRKMRHLSDQGFVAMLETTRRDNCPPWKAYFDFNPSYARFVEYLIARYGAYNIIFSKIHLDIAPKKTSLTPAEFNAALVYHLNKYGPMPFGQPVTSPHRSLHLHHLQATPTKRPGSPCIASATGPATTPCTRPSRPCSACPATCPRSTSSPTTPAGTTRSTTPTANARP